MTKQIIALMPRHLQYVEPYFGGGSVLFARDPDDERLWLPPHKGVSEVVNDLNEELTNFWATLRDETAFSAFHRMAQATEFSGRVWEGAANSGSVACPVHRGEDGEPDVEAAWRFFTTNRQSLAGRMDSFTGITQTRTRARMNNEASAWLSCVDKLPEFHARLRRVLVLPYSPALDVIERFDGTGTLMYIDAPYVHATRATTGEYGAFEMTDDDHRELIALLVESKSKFIVSMYHHPIYDALHCKYGWHMVECDLPNQASGAKLKKRMVECLWTNYPPP